MTVSLLWVSKHKQIKYQQTLPMCFLRFLGKISELTSQIKEGMYPKFKKKKGTKLYYTICESTVCPETTSGSMRLRVTGWLTGGSYQQLNIPEDLAARLRMPDSLKHCKAEQRQDVLRVVWKIFLYRENLKVGRLFNMLHSKVEIIKELKGD